MPIELKAGGPGKKIGKNPNCREKSEHTYEPHLSERIRKRRRKSCRKGGNYILPVGGGKHD